MSNPGGASPGGANVHVARSFATQSATSFGSRFTVLPVISTRAGFPAGSSVTCAVILPVRSCAQLGLQLPAPLARLTEYFQQWCQALQVEPLYPRLKAMLQGAAWS